MPNVIVPRQIRETKRPELPRYLYFILAHPVFRGGLKKPLRNYLASFLTPCDYTPKNQLKTLRLRTSWISLMILPHMILSVEFNAIKSGQNHDW